MFTEPVQRIFQLEKWQLRSIAVWDRPTSRQFPGL